MQSSEKHDAFIAFMSDYTDFLSKMCADESNKLAAIASRELVQIEQSITTSQANAKQLQNLEEKRLRLQSEAGYEGMSFRQLIGTAPAVQQDGLWKLFSKFENNVAEIKFFNDKSMAMARDNMVVMDPEAVLAAQGGAKPNNPYEDIRSRQEGPSGLLETKV